ncbi:TPA: hypothetical protein N0F65_000485 [Lagenidium giganteum]|uniref:ABC transporter domain-containing protein n=1 Tax=Lagenidium giganteum TaxID=4803 RepID=A0AAV2Z014_9STRA|nr:TPA: hypothetical protein N0F65_000485 [Lagenidium giganteum]
MPAAILLLVLVKLSWWMTNSTNVVAQYAQMKDISSQIEDWTVETTTGATFIRALGVSQRDRFLRQYKALLDTDTQREFASSVQNSHVLVWFAIYKGWLLTLVVCATFQSAQLPPNALPFLLICSLLLPSQVIAVTTSIVNTHTKLLSISRIRQITHLAMSKSHQVCAPTIAIPPNWPSHGRICFENVSFTYPSKLFKSVPVLRDVSFSINSGEKVGLVGRTGSGKSSVMMALFRIHELTQGRILKDGIDIRKLSVRDLRSRLGVIPQSPVFYRCSVRAHLDPFDEFDDAALWSVLKKAGLGGSGSVHVTTLDATLAEDGANWSVGERQLLSLARALLSPSRVLVLDEAFSSLAPARDDAVLRLIVREFKTSTVVLITHRMDQVLHFDRIMVMHDGCVVESGGVEELLTNPASKFFEMLETSPLVE